MKILTSFLKTFIWVLVFSGIATFVVTQYSWIFSKTVKGKILNVERVTNPTAIIGSKLTDAQIHSYSILLEGTDGRLYTASSEDRQWQVATKGYCVEAKLYRYPPWDIEKANTFFNARILELRLCEGSGANLPQPTGP